jgi:hypothetical protein
MGGTARLSDALLSQVRSVRARAVRAVGSGSLSQLCQCWSGGILRTIASPGWKGTAPTVQGDGDQDCMQSDLGVQPMAQSRDDAIRRGSTGRRLPQTGWARLRRCRRLRLHPAQPGAEMARPRPAHHNRHLCRCRRRRGKRHRQEDVGMRDKLNRAPCVVPPGALYRTCRRPKWTARSM